MNKILLVAAFFIMVLSSEIIMVTTGVETHEICQKELAKDVESKKDCNEKSGENNKIEILLTSGSDKENRFSKRLIFTKEPLINDPYLDQATPPPKA